MGAADLFCAAKAAEGASPRTVEWYRMIVGRAVRRFGEARSVDAIPVAELRARLLELRASLAPVSMGGYVRGLKGFGNSCAREEVATAGGFRGLRRPKVPRQLTAPFSEQFVDGIYVPEVESEEVPAPRPPLDKARMLCRDDADDPPAVDRDAATHMKPSGSGNVRGRSHRLLLEKSAMNLVDRGRKRGAGRPPILPPACA
jgi:hypothetical protein